MNGQRTNSKYLFWPAGVSLTIREQYKIRVYAVKTMLCLKLNAALSSNNNAEQHNTDKNVSFYIFPT